MSNPIGYLDAFMQDLIRAKHVYYSQECFSYYLEEDRFLVEDLYNVRNRWGERIKCTLVRHRDEESGRCDGEGMNEKCIVYLHGFGSSRLQSLHMIPLLPDNYCLCVFDLSGSGKSQGEFMTYGLKESEDIEPVVQQLIAKKGIEEIILWGRSMGAVATLLYAIQKYPFIPRKPPSIFRNNRDSLSSSRHQSEVSDTYDKKIVKAIVLDSPFHNFRQVAKEIAISRFSVPAFLADFAMKYVEQSFSHVLRDAVGEQYSPFNICLGKQISLSIPAIILSSDKDEVVPSDHSQRIAKLFTTKFEKIPINECNHNEPRPENIIKPILEKLDKYLKPQSTIGKYSSISCQRKRGIFVFTPSKEKQNRSDSLKRPFYDLKYQMTPQQSPKNDENRSNERNYKSLKKSKLFLESSKRAKEQTKEDDSQEVNIPTVDSQASNLINKKLIGIKERQITNLRFLRSRRCIQRKKQNKPSSNPSQFL